MGTHNKQTRIKDFEGLPHSLKGLDYTDDAEVEGGEKGYTPLGSENEFIFRKISKNIKDLQKEDKLRENRPKGDRISDISFDAAAANVIMKEIKDLVSEGIDPFNVGNDQKQNAFKVGGVKYATGGTVPRIDDTVVAGEQGAQNANTAVGAIGSAANIASNAIPTTGKYDQPLQTETGIMQSTGDTVAGAAGVPFYQETKAVSNLGDQLGDLGQEQDNQALARTGDFIEGIDTFGTVMKSIDAADKGIISKGENVGIQALNFLGGPWGQMFLGEKEKQYYDNQEKQAGYDATLAERGRFEGEGDIPRTRYNDQVTMKNGGMRKKYSGEDGSVRPKNEGFNPYNITMEDLGDSYLTADDTGGVPYYGAQEAILNPEQKAAQTNWDLPEMPYQTPSMDGYTTAPQDPAKAPQKKMTPEQIKQLYQGILGFSTNAAGSIAYLAGEGKDYDKVKYPTYRPEQITADAQLREARDQSASTIEALRKQGKLDPNALAQLATSGSKSTAGIRENVANYNIGNRNQAHQFNIGTNIRAQQDEAANKGQALTNYYNAIENLGKAGAGAINQSGKIDNDKMILAMYENVFGKNKVV